jgi:dephospho-CoA kinase
MKILGLTGGIGSGKSTAAQILSEFGAKVIDADKVAHEVFNPGTEGLQKVVETFGEGVLNSKGEINRKKLGEIVFNDPSALATLNGIIHPRAYDLTKSRLEEFRRQGTEVVVLEVILLVEAGWDHLVDEIWVTMATEDTVVKRLQESRGLTKEEILARIHAQTPNEERTKYADVIIENDGSYEELKAKLNELWNRIKDKKSRQKYF